MTEKAAMTIDASTEMPTLRFEMGSKVVPGDRLGSIQQIFPGIGTYAKGGHVYASVLGTLLVDRIDTTETDSITRDKAKLSAQFRASVTPQRRLASDQVLRVGHLVVARVIRVAAPQATVEIMALEGWGPLATTSEGTIPREECVKSGGQQEVTSREIPDCFQPNDLILAKVLGMGDARRYLLTTAAPTLGVVHAVSQTSGQPMIPCSWKEMECPETGIKEPRKCAKPRQILTTTTTNEETQEQPQTEGKEDE